ncbi:MAG: alpha/beta hydrolase [Candidatus Lokiarchaeota archaeon]|nr:alpha/beta hydrolase [Candidatus Lokiarchaeota archaeon]
MIEKKVLILSTTGSDLHGIHYVESKKSKSTSILIMCHGFTGDKYEHGHFPALAKTCNKEGIDGLIFDFTGSGENERVPITLFKQIEDLESVYKWVQNEGYGNIAVLGLSFGGLTALGANLPGIKTYVFWAPVLFLHTTDDQADWFKDLDKGPVEIPSTIEGRPVIIDMNYVTDFAKLRVKSHLKKLDKTVLIVVGTSDEKTPYELTRKAFQFLPINNENKLVAVENAPHGFEGEHLKEFIKHTIDWLKFHLG